MLLKTPIYFTIMKIKKSGEGVVWWRTRATCHNRVTVTCERHPLKSPRFSRS